MDFIKRYKKILAMTLAVSLAFSVAGVTTDGFGYYRESAFEQSTSEDRRIAEEISSLTGLEVKKLIELKQEKGNWNEVLEEVRGASDAGVSQELDKYLAGYGLEDNVASELSADGFGEDEVEEAKLLVERVMFQLSEIVSAADSTEYDNLTSVQAETKTDEEMESFRLINQKIDVNSCVSLILRLKKDLGGLDPALDEYLCALQLDLDLELYFQDPGAYQEQKSEKMTGNISQKLITALKIEEAMLKRLNAYSESELKPEQKTEGSLFDSSVSLPKTEAPKLTDIYPENPANVLINEIEAIDPMKNMP